MPGNSKQCSGGDTRVHHSCDPRKNRNTKGTLLAPKATCLSSRYWPLLPHRVTVANDGPRIRHSKRFIKDTCSSESFLASMSALEDVQAVLE